MKQITRSFLVFAGLIWLLFLVWELVGRQDRPTAQGQGDDKGGLNPAQAKVEVAKTTKADTASLARSCNEFALDLYRQLTAKQTKDNANLVVAPYSIAESLGMAGLGARNQTATEIAATLRLKLKPEQVGPVFASLGVGSGGHLTEETTVARYRFGAVIRDAQGGGVEVVEVKDNSPALKAGLKPLDCIVRLGDQEINNSIDYANALDAFPDYIEGAVRNAQGTRTFNVPLAAPTALTKRLRPLIANAVWARKDVEFLPSFKETASLYFGAATETLDFQRDAPQARAQINQWVAGKTENNIQNLLTANSVTPDTLLVLTNAVFFQADWAHPFQEGNTTKEDFFAPDKKLSVAMMHKTWTFRYGKGPGFQILELPYEGDFAMTLFLPAKRDGLAAFEKDEFTIENIDQWHKQLREKRVKVSLPRFKVNAEADLKSALTALGMSTAFSKKADFTGMTKQPGIGLSDLVHKAEIEVNEKGTKASSGTAGTFAPLATAIEFTADRPFLFSISDTRTGVILFVGRVMVPAP